MKNITVVTIILLTAGATLVAVSLWQSDRPDQPQSPAPNAAAAADQHAETLGEFRQQLGELTEEALATKRQLLAFLESPKATPSPSQSPDP